MKEVAGFANCAAQRLDAFFAAMPDTVKWFDRYFASRIAVALFLLVFTFAARMSVMGDPGYHIDEQFYALVGQRMLAGDLLYVDIWDRKPPGLYLLYAAMVSTGGGFWAVHITAAIFVWITACFVAAIAGRFAPMQGAILSAMLYVLLLGTFTGGGGQSPVFYNAFMVFAAWRLVARDERLSSGIVDLDILLAMFSAGIAITIKQTAAFEAVFFGVWASARLLRGLTWQNALPKIATLALAGALPITLCFAYYMEIGELGAIWVAVIDSNMNRIYNIKESNSIFSSTIISSSLIIGISIIPILINVKDVFENKTWKMVVIWCIISIISLTLYPNKSDHYFLSFFMTISLAASQFLGRRDFGLAVGIILLAFYAGKGQVFRFSERNNSRQEIGNYVNYLDKIDAKDGIFIYGGPVFPYFALQSKPMTPLAFPMHINDRTERDVSQYDTRMELSRVLDQNPRVIVQVSLRHYFRPDRELMDMVDSYVRARCTKLKIMDTRNTYSTERVFIHSGCAKAAKVHPKASTAPSEMARP